jgi:hypothetical protein
LNNLEKAVLEAMLVAVDGEEADVFERQIVSLHVLRRENTGAGFYTYFERPSAPLYKNGQMIYTEDTPMVTAELDGCHYPMIFTLFLKDGFMHFLEGAAPGENTERIDFSNVAFKTPEVPQLT